MGYFTSIILFRLFALLIPLVTILFGPTSPNVRFWYPDPKHARIACWIIGGIQVLIWLILIFTGRW